ncbi:MAG: UDP-N-acetylmuramate--L-alanine ligase [Bacteroidetes bacterium]|nr:UDP-N-acetylmuramate--L-alanine ligase [Bacteroidota bacterium]
MYRFKDLHIDQFKSVYFLGIGGIGMSAIARYFLQHNYKVAGYDKTETELTKELIQLGAEVSYTDDLNTIPNTFQDQQSTLVIRTPAVPSDHLGWNFFKENNFTILKRAELLGVLTQSYKGLAVAGTHGKTTTSTLLAHLLHHSNLRCNAFLGGISSNYKTNYISDENAIYTVVEADEFDRSFHQLSPYCSIITAMDSDHLDIYGTEEKFHQAFQEYADLINDDGILIRHLDVQLTSKCPNISYHLTNTTADYYLSNLSYENGCFQFDAHGPDFVWKNIVFGLPGTHNAENALACLIQGKWLGLSEEKIRAAFKTFKGVKRRFDYHLKSEDFVYIDDYAHHPTEINALLNSIDLLYPGWKKIGVFQPHLFSRTKDFFDGFAKQLSRLDQCILLPIYPARELPIEGISSEALLKEISSNSKFVLSPNQVINSLEIQSKTVLLTIGAGDIDRLVQPIKTHFSA